MDTVESRLCGDTKFRKYSQPEPSTMVGSCQHEPRCCFAVNRCTKVFELNLNKAQGVDF